MYKGMQYSVVWAKAQIRRKPQAVKKSYEPNTSVNRIYSAVKLKKNLSYLKPG
jgi:hypothetical protein